uniref:Endonuclease/exonuclease/phosphatase domain-containing protein n=1 Tax=Sinocyclocheilus rhinocerous TaxID=307959 RepID=A0A673GYK7_9TELE
CLGVAIFKKKDSVEGTREVYKDQRGRILVVEFIYGGMNFRLINIYVPNIEVDRREILEELKGLVVGKCIIVGDFNIKCSRLDVGKGVKVRWEKSRGIGMLMEIMREKGLLDVWRYENPEKREFTRRQLKEGTLKQRLHDKSHAIFNAHLVSKAVL